MGWFYYGKKVHAWYIDPTGIINQNSVKYPYPIGIMQKKWNPHYKFPNGNKTKDDTNSPSVPLLKASYSTMLIKYYPSNNKSTCIVCASRSQRTRNIIARTHLLVAGHQWTASTSTGCNRWLSLAKPTLKVALLNTNRSPVARTNKCGWAISQHMPMTITWERGGLNSNMVCA